MRAISMAALAIQAALLSSFSGATPRGFNYAVDPASLRDGHEDAQDAAIKAAEEKRKRRKARNRALLKKQ